MFLIRFGSIFPFELSTNKFIYVLPYTFKYKYIQYAVHIEELGGQPYKIRSAQYMNGPLPTRQWWEIELDMSKIGNITFIL